MVGPALALLVILGGAWAAQAGAPETSPRPMPRPDRATLDLRPGPQAAEDGGVVAPEVGNRVAVTVPVLSSPRARPRPAAVGQVRQAAPVSGQPRGAGTAELRAGPAPGGALCGSARIRGETVAPVTSSVPGCGIARPVRVTEVDGVRLSRPALMDCDTARALETWVTRGLKPAIGREGGGVAQLQVAAHYSCRTRNNRPGARLSEHARGRAIDISGIVLRNGTNIAVLEGWRDRWAGPFLRRAHRAACGPFGTVLGPDADRFHQDHFHFDTARHRRGPYCR